MPQANHAKLRQRALAQAGLAQKCLWELVRFELVTLLAQWIHAQHQQDLSRASVR